MADIDPKGPPAWWEKLNLYLIDLDKRITDLEAVSPQFKSGQNTPPRPYSFMLRDGQNTNLFHNSWPESNKRCWSFQYSIFAIGGINSKHISDVVKIVRVDNNEPDVTGLCEFVKYSVPAYGQFDITFTASGMDIVQFEVGEMILSGP